MDHYVTLGAIDPVASFAFYDAVFATIGFAKRMEFPGWRAYSAGGGDAGLTVWIVTPFDGKTATAGNGVMIGLAAPSRAAVDAFHAAAMAHGGAEEGAPGERPNYGPNWYAAYVRDPTGNKLAVVHNG
ncbi:VOC family protein [Sphingomonas donggukensis]|uniref:VOC family protein n=1 Tax=Sphingomonas donggukensis TaxID=2949093 RepID=A0ABY4TPW1_9SPHN|nr:VOC family protein [Sphingomonas donggukensis]URW74429.1 VOC family protein [Sphingomonas donggukensis]